MKDFFRFEEYHTDFKTEVIAGTTSFLAAMYIIVVNPAIISSTGMPFSGVLTATVLVCAFSSIAMGLYARTPILVAPGMGINAFFTYTIVIGMGVKWETALGTVFWSGVIFMILSVLNVRNSIVRAIPRQMRFAVSSGIGLFITFIGLTDASFIVRNPATLVGFNRLNPITVTFIIGLMITSILFARKVRGAMILGIASTTLLAIPIGRLYGDASAITSGVPTLVTWKGLLAFPDFGMLMKLDLLGSLQYAMLPVIFVFLFTGMFDSLSTFIGVAEAGGLVDENGEPRYLKRALIADAFSTMISGIFGTSSGTAYIESATGIAEGGRTGLTAITAGLLFLPFMFLSPLLSVVPRIATAPALVLVGAFMMKPVLNINWGKLDDAFPAFLAMILIPLTYSITQGIIWGFISWTVIKLALGKRSEVSWMLIVIDVFAVAAVILGYK